MKLVGIIILCILALLSLFYGISVMMLKSGTIFFVIWFIICAFLLLMAFLWYKDLFIKIPKIIIWIFSVLFFIGFSILIYTQILIFKGFNYDVPKDLDYIIVLGAQLKSNGPGAVLQYRLDAAIEYLNSNENTKCIVSGGKGSNEPLSEAEGMKKYLIEKGISEDRIIVENQSLNTIQNITYSMKLFDYEHSSVGIVTSNYHLYRAVQIAKKQGIKNVIGIKAYSTPYYLPNNCLREFIGILKDTVLGNM